MIRYQLYLATALLLLVSIRSYSQNDKHISVSQAWEEAFTNYPGLVERKAQIRESEYWKTEIQYGFLPQVQVQLQNTYGSYAGSTGAFFPLPGIFNVSGNNRLNGQPDAAANSYGSVLMDWKLFEFGKQRKEVEAAKYGSDSAAYIAAKAKTRASGQLEKYLRIKSPFDGTITDRNVSVGALVGENNQKPLFSIAQQEHLRLTVAIPEKHAHSVNTYTPVTFTVSGRPGKVYNSRLSRNGGLLNQTTRSVMTEFDVENITKSLSGGEYAQVKLKLQRPDSTLWVPVTSLINTQSGIFILKLNNGVVQRIPVMEGSRKDSSIEVFGDITTKDQIIKKGSEELEEGTKITIKE